MAKHSARGVAPFRRTWGHVMMLVVSVLMLAAGLALVVYCGPRYADVQALGSEFAQAAAFASLFYLIGLVLGVAMLVPAIVGIITGIRSRRGTVALMLAGIAVFADAVLFVVLLVAYDATLVGAAIYFVCLLVPPLLYGIAALGIRRSSRS